MALFDNETGGRFAWQANESRKREDVQTLSRAAVAAPI